MMYIVQYFIGSGSMQGAGWSSQTCIWWLACQSLVPYAFL